MQLKASDGNSDSAWGSVMGEKAGNSFSSFVSVCEKKNPGKTLLKCCAQKNELKFKASVHRCSHCFAPGKTVLSSILLSYLYSGLSPEIFLRICYSAVLKYRCLGPILRDSDSLGLW